MTPAFGPHPAGPRRPAAPRRTPGVAQSLPLAVPWPEPDPRTAVLLFFTTGPNASMENKGRT